VLPFFSKGGDVPVGIANGVFLRYPSLSITNRTAFTTMITCIIFGSLAAIVIIAMAYIRFSESSVKKGVEKHLKDPLTIDGRTVEPEWYEKDWTDVDNNLLAFDKEHGVFLGVTAGKRKSDRVDIRVIPVASMTRSEVVVDGRTVLEARAGKITGRHPENSLDAFRQNSQKIKSIELRVRSVSGGHTIPCSPGKYGISLAEKYHILLLEAMMSSGTSPAPMSRKMKKS